MRFSLSSCFPTSLASLFGQAPRLADPRVADSAIAAEVTKVRAVDDHTHVPRLLAAGEKDEEYDALPCGGYLEPMSDPLLARPEENALYRAAWKALWGAENGKQAAEARARKRKDLGDQYPAWVLDQLAPSRNRRRSVTMKHDSLSCSRSPHL